MDKGYSGSRIKIKFGVESEYMRKYLLIMVLVIFVIPTIAFASWWNPFDWSIFHRTDIKTQILEKRIQELESKLNNNVVTIATTTSIQEIIIATTTATTTVVKKEVKKIIPTNDKSKIAWPETKTDKGQNSPQSTKVSTPIQTIVPSIQSVIDYKLLYDELLAKYVSMRDQAIDNEINNVENSGTKDNNQQEYLRYLNKLYYTLDNFIGKVNKRQPSELDFWKTTYEQLAIEYNNEKKNYNTAIKDRERTLSEQATYNAEQVALENQRHIQNIKVKIAEMNQLDTQIDALSGDTLINYLNIAKKLNNDPIFKTFTPSNPWSVTMVYPYTYMPDDYKYNLHNFVKLYRSELQVELAKIQY